MPRTKARGQRPVFALDVVNNGRARPGQQRRNDEADALARSCRCEAQHMLRTVVAEIVVVQFPEHDAIWSEQTSASDLGRRRPARRTMGLDILRLPGAPD